MNESLQDWVYRCMALGIEPVVEGLVFKVQNNDVILCGLDTKSSSNRQLYTEYVNLKSRFLELKVPIEDIEIDWKGVFNSIYDILAVHQFYGFKLVISGLKVVKSFKHIKTIDTVYFLDAIEFKPNAFENSTISRLYATKVKTLGEKCFRGCNISELYFDSLDRVGFYEIENFRYLTKLAKLKLATTYTLEAEGAEYLTNGRETAMTLLDSRQFKSINIKTLGYSLLHKESVTYKNVEYLVGSTTFYGDIKRAKYISLTSLKRVPAYTFCVLRDSSIYLDSAIILDSSSFVQCEIKTLYLPSCKKLDVSVFDSCLIYNLLLPNVEVLDLAELTKENCILPSMMHIYVGEDTIVQNDYYDIVERKGLEDAKRFIGVHL